ncbi:MAG: DUF2334 domain-containing protein [Methanobacteriota archaeon]|nr:MAG: DUF2334 domain-containing protein [Euryarchaeota archaeon]
MPVLNLLLLLLSAGLLALLLWNIEARYYIEGPCVRFTEDRYVKVGLYPGDAEAVFLFSADDLSADTDDRCLSQVLSLLEKHGVKGTFFTIPRVNGDEAAASLAKQIQRVLSKGHEVAQHGFSHRRRRHAWIPFFGSYEFRGLGYEEQLKRVRMGKEILESLNATVQGFRTPHFSSSPATLDILIKEGFQYVSDVRIHPEGKITNKRLLGVVYGSIYYPYFWETGHGRCLIIPTNGDYTWNINRVIRRPDLFLAKKRFNRYYEHRGVFCLLTHLHPLALEKDRGLRFLDSLLHHVTGEDVWAPTMAEFTRWWAARCSLHVKTEIDGELCIMLSTPDGKALDGLRLEIKHQGPYRILHNGKEVARGAGEDVVHLSLPG